MEGFSHHQSRYFAAQVCSDARQLAWRDLSLRRAWFGAYLSRDGAPLLAGAISKISPLSSNEISSPGSGF